MSKVMGLLHLSREKGNAVNFLSSDVEAFAVHGGCASLLDRSLRYHRHHLSVFTNASVDLIGTCPELARHATVLPTDFRLRIPSGTLFYSAHHKLELIRIAPDAFGDDELLLLDLDAVCLRNPEELVVSEADRLGVYDRSCDEFGPMLPGGM